MSFLTKVLAREKQANKRMKTKFNTVKGLYEFEKFCLRLIDPNDPLRAGHELNFINKMLYKLSEEERNIDD